MSLTREDLEKLVALREGGLYEQSLAHHTVRQIQATGLFWDTQVGVVPADTDGGQVDVMITVIRLYRVDRIRFKGDLKLSQQELRRELAFREGEPYSDETLEQTFTRLRQRYQQSGFYQCRIEPSFTLAGERARLSIEFLIDSGSQARVSSVAFDFEGTLPEGLLEGLRTRPGVFFAEEQLNEDLATIRRRLALEGHFRPEIYIRDGVQFDAARNEVDLVLRIIPREKTDISFEGVELDRNALLELPLYQNLEQRRLQIEETARFLTLGLQAEGYFRASVTVEQKGPSFPPTSVRFIVDRVRKYDLADIHFEGAGPVPEGTLKKGLATRTAGFYQRGLLTNETLVEDVERLEAIYQQKGYQDVEVSTRMDTEDENLTLIFVIVPGPFYEVGEVRIEGNASISDEVLERELSLVPGQAFSAFALATDRSSLAAAYESRGYRSVSVSSDVERRDGHRVDILHRVEEGPQLFTRDVLIAGNRLTRRSIIQGEIPLASGDPLSLDGILKAETNLYGLAVFSRVRVREIPHFEQPYQRFALFSVEEARRYLLTYGVGYSQSFGSTASEGLRGTLGITDNNFMGRARSLSLSLRAGRNRQRGNLTYVVPRVFGRRVPSILSFSVDNEKRIQDPEQPVFRIRGRPYDAFRIIGSAQTERVLSRRESIFLRYNLERTRLDVPPELEDPLEFFREEENLLLSAVALSYLNESREPVLDPKRGFYLNGEAKLAAKAFGSERQFMRLFTEGRYYKPLYTDLVLASALRIGIQAPFGGNPPNLSNPVPISERFFAGGPTSLRGFPIDLAGPLLRDPETGEVILVGEPGNQFAVPTGGNALVIANTELRFPIIGFVGGALFHDIGNVFTKLTEIPNEQFTNSVGAGLAINTPIGPFRIDFAYNPDPPRIEGFKRWHIHFNIGQPF